MITQDRYVGELGGYKVFKKLYIEYYYAVDPNGKFKVSGDSYCEVFDELAYIILEQAMEE